jgi:hypothetical protein
MRIQDPGWKKLGSGINIPGAQHSFSSYFRSLGKTAIIIIKVDLIMNSTYGIPIQICFITGRIGIG